MKNTLKTFAFLILFLLLITSACTRDQNETNFTVSEQEIQIPGEGGECCIGYTLTFPKIDGKLTIDNTAEWVSDFDLTTPGEIRFQVESNYQAEDRSTTLTVSYTGSGQSYPVTLSQTTGTFGITISEIGENSAHALVIPKDEKMTYILMTVKKEFYEELGSDEKLYEEVIKLYKEYAKMYDMPLSDFLKQAALRTGKYDSDITDLSIATEYYFFAVGMDENGNQTSEVVKSYFKTKEIEKIDIDFQIETLVNGPDVEITVTPSIEDQLYFFNAIRKSELEDSGKSIEEYAESYIAGQIYLGSFTGSTPEEVIKEISSKGKDTFKTCLKTQTDYIAYAFALTKSGIIISEVQTKDFRTEDIIPSENQLTITTDIVTVDGVKYTLKPSNNDPYVSVVLDAQETAGLSDTKIIEMILLDFNLETLTAKGTRSYERSRLRPDTDYRIYAFGYYAEKPTTGLFYKEFHTLESENPEDLLFNLDISDVTSKSASLKVTATPETALYLCQICLADATEEQIKNDLEAEIKYNIDMGHAEDRAEYMRLYGYRGNYSNVLGNLEPETSYKVYAIGIHDSDGSFATDMVFSETFTTLERVDADIDIAVHHDKYYDGTELGKLDPEYEDADGVAVMPASVEITGKAKNYYYHIFNDNLTDPEKYPDDVIIQNLLTAGIKNSPSILFYCTFDVDLTILAVAEDENGNFSKVYREKIHLTHEGTSPAEDFFKKNRVPEYRPALKLNL